jgi:hypothetical protein
MRATTTTMKTKTKMGDAHALVAALALAAALPSCAAKKPPEVAAKPAEAQPRAPESTPELRALAERALAPSASEEELLDFAVKVRAALASGAIRSPNESGRRIGPFGGPPGGIVARTLAALRAWTKVGAEGRVTDDPKPGERRPLTGKLRGLLIYEFAMLSHQVGDDTALRLAASVEPGLQDEGGEEPSLRTNATSSGARTTSEAAQAARSPTVTRRPRLGMQYCAAIPRVCWAR